MTNPLIWSTIGVITGGAITFVVAALGRASHQAAMADIVPIPLHVLRRELIIIVCFSLLDLGICPVAFPNAVL